MNEARVFRTFLLSDAILTTASIVTDFLMTETSTPDAPKEPLLYTVIEISVLAIWLVALAGQWRFRSWARILRSRTGRRLRQRSSPTWRLPASSG